MHKVLLLTMLCIAVSGAGCFPEKDQELKRDDINIVMKTHLSALMEIEGVSIVAIGELPDKTPCIVVYVEAWTDGLRDKIPQELGGYPVDVRESGKIEPMGSGN